MGDFLNKEGIEEIRKGWDRIKILQEEMRSMREDIGEEKKEIAKKTGIKVRELNRIFKIVAEKEKGEWDDEDVELADQIAGKITHIPPKGLNE